jgi:hypothetical protein
MFAYEVERPLLGFIENAAQILADNAERQKLQPAKKQHDD